MAVFYSRLVFVLNRDRQNRRGYNYDVGVAGLSYGVASSKIV